MHLKNAKQITKTMSKKDINDEKKTISEETTEFVDLDEEGEEFSDSSKVKKKIKDLKEKLEAKEKEAKEYLDGWQRARAEMVNKEKQLLSDRQDFIKAGNRSLMEALLPSLDNFQMAKKNKEIWESVNEGWRNGIEYIFNNMRTALEEEGLREIKPNIGEKFDVNFMETIEEVTTEDEEKDHTIAEVLQSGYKHFDKLLRPVKVKIFVKK